MIDQHRDRFRTGLEIPSRCTIASSNSPLLLGGNRRIFPDSPQDLTLSSSKRGDLPQFLQIARSASRCCAQRPHRRRPGRRCWRRKPCSSVRPFLVCSLGRPNSPGKIAHQRLIGRGIHVNLFLRQADRQIGGMSGQFAARGLGCGSNFLLRRCHDLRAHLPGRRPGCALLPPQPSFSAASRIMPISTSSFIGAIRSRPACAVLLRWPSAPPASLSGSRPCGRGTCPARYLRPAQKITAGNHRKIQHHAQPIGCCRLSPVIRAIRLHRSRVLEFGRLVFFFAGGFARLMRQLPPGAMLVRRRTGLPDLVRG